MNCIVCIKQVPDVSEVSWDPVTGSLIRKGIPSIINPSDKTAIEAALRIREQCGGRVVVLSMGPSQVDEALREATAMGADEAIQLTSKQFAGSDTRATSYTLGLAVKKIGQYDLIICGKEALDGMTAQVGPQLAEFLNIPQLTYAVRIDVREDRVRVNQKLGDVRRVLETRLPALITVERELNEPRMAPMDAIIEAYGKEIEVWGPHDLDGDHTRFGLKGSPTKLRKMYSPKLVKSRLEMLQGNREELARRVVQILKTRRFL
jgi:electron transfer flavoprotein alpha/beta subunit